MGTRLANKVCVVTGAGSGIGQASARLFASEGGRVVVADIDLAAARETAEEIAMARRVSYAASKGAVLAMTRSMQVDLAPHGVRVNALLPGTILTPFVERYLKESYSDPEEGLATIRKRQLSHELGRPEDVAAAALFLASDESRFMMASGLVIDGGMTGAK